MLRARGGAALPDRVASPELALLFLTLSSPSPIPARFEDLVPGRLDAFLGSMVLDRVVEIAVAGGFASGPEALRMLEGERPSGQGVLAQMSRRAVLYAVTLAGLDPQQLAWRVYCYGRQPWRSGRVGQASTGSSEHPWVVSEKGLHATELWVTSSVSAAWTMWRPRVPSAPTDRATFKLYVSPSVEDTPAVWRQSMTDLATAPGIVGVKLARGEDGLRRPDKLVAYFARFEDLQGAAALLARTLRVDRAHGVPLSAEIVESGLLSWGADRPAGPGRPSQSWRMWLSDRVAAHALATTGGRPARAESVLAALNAEGVDTSRWAPSGEFWSSVRD